MRVTKSAANRAFSYSDVWLPSGRLTTELPTDINQPDMKSILLTLLAVPFLAIAVHAEDKPGKPAGEPGAKPDKPKMDPAEAYKKMDKDSDGKLTIEEFKATPRWKKDPTKADEMFKRRDKDASGDISLEEFTAKLEKPKKP